MVPFLDFLSSAAISGVKPTGSPVFCRALNCLPLLSYSGTSSCGTYPSLMRLGLRQVPSGRWVAGMNLEPKI